MEKNKIGKVIRECRVCKYVQFQLGWSWNFSLRRKSFLIDLK